MARRVLLAFSLVIGILSLLFASWLALSLTRERDDLASATTEDARQRVEEVTARIDGELGQVPPLAAALAEDIRSGRLSTGAFAARAAELLRSHEIVSGIGFVSRAAPEAPPAGRWVLRGDGSLREMPFDQADLQAQWYTEALGGSPGWREPAPDRPERRLTAKYSVPVRPAQQNLVGALVVSVAIDRIAGFLEPLNQAEGGWGAMLSRQGFLLAHPSVRLVTERTNAFEAARQQNDEAVLAAVDRIARGESGFVEGVNRMTGQSSWFVFAPVRETGWAVVAVRIRDVVLKVDQPFIRRVIQITLAAIVGLLLLAFWTAVRAHERHPRDAILWALVAFASLLLIGGVSVIRRVGFHQPRESGVEAVRVLDRAGLQSFLNAQEKKIAEQFGGLPVHIPTGVFLDSLKFVSSTEILMTGIVWQRFAGQPPEDLRPQFSLPDAGDPSIREAYRRRVGEHTTVGWSFEATVRQNLDLSRFPFDHENVLLRILATEFDQNVILVPDLGAYDLTNPSARPGVDESVNLPGWDITGSFFEYRFGSYSTDFGVPGSLRARSFPELWFSMSIRRRLFDAAVSYGVPLLVVFALIFAVIASTTKDPGESQLLGSNPAGVMRVTTALFFVALIAHVQLRNALQTQQIVLLEYTYFTAYLALLATTIHSFLFHLKRFNVRIVEYRDSLILKLFYWPVVIGVQLAVTVAMFY